MKRFIISIFSAAAALGVHAQTIDGSPALMQGATKQQFLDSTLKHAGASPAQLQQFKAAKALAANKSKQVRLDSSLTPPRKDSALKAINDEKNTSYRNILGNEVYKNYNSLKSLKLSAQRVELSRPSPNKMVRDCLDSANATNAQKQQFMQIKKLYKDSVKAVQNNSSLTPAQKKQQQKLLIQHKNEQYLQLLGAQKYARFNQAKRRREQGENN